MKAGMMDYWLSRLFYDLHTDRLLASEYRTNRDAVMVHYPLNDAVSEMLRRDDVAALAELTNPFLLRYYFLVAGMRDSDFIAALQANRSPTDG
jgi:hypothetical protein